MRLIGKKSSPDETVKKLARRRDPQARARAAIDSTWTNATGSLTEFANRGRRASRDRRRKLAAAVAAGVAAVGGTVAYLLRRRGKSPELVGVEGSSTAAGGHAPNPEEDGASSDNEKAGATA